MAPGRSRIRVGGASAEFLPSLLELSGEPSTRLVNNSGDDHLSRPHIFDPERRHELFVLSDPSRLLQPSVSGLPPESRQHFVQSARGVSEVHDQATRVASIFETWRVDHGADDDRKRFAQNAFHATDPVSIMIPLSCVSRQGHLRNAL